MLTQRQAAAVRKSYELHPGVSSETCMRCPAYCCKSDVVMTYAEFAGIADTLEQQGRLEDVLSKEAGLKCRLLEGNRCSVYEQRPVICRHYKAGPFTPLETGYGKSRETECSFAGGYLAGQLDMERLNEETIPDELQDGGPQRRIFDSWVNLSKSRGVI
ncbi:MAG: YkgJ family cysteine cluster protein [Candidatus Aenigmarchaeota archaeon]|nr:YkgJ family cysteine cluster protein [Candidatus Aenigmarchaeota archaeon]